MALNMNKDLRDVLEQGLDLKKTFSAKGSVMSIFQNDFCYFRPNVI
jgi:hypothetical protein